MVFEHLEEKEAVEIASLIERNGFAFYSILADKVEDKAVKDVFKRLAKEEKRHINALERRYYPEAGFGEQITDEEIAIEDYVSRSTDPKIFTEEINVEKLVHAIDSVKKAVILAIHTEKYASEYFEGMAKKARTKGGAEMYKELADEERGHAKELEDIMKSM
ncbi:MAG TPA: ferritin family protein [Thermodesulfobacteriota bacterium]|nr:ferritin family protein [Thermodesulfobacteriota bacterium]